MFSLSEYKCTLHHRYDYSQAGEMFSLSDYKCTLHHRYDYSQAGEMFSLSEQKCTRIHLVTSVIIHQLTPSHWSVELEVSPFARASAPE